jgi:hypothetical protein
MAIESTPLCCVELWTRDHLHHNAISHLACTRSPGCISVVKPGLCSPSWLMRTMLFLVRSFEPSSYTTSTKSLEHTRITCAGLHTSCPRHRTFTLAPDEDQRIRESNRLEIYGGGQLHQYMCRVCVRTSYQPFAQTSDVFSYLRNKR